MLDAHRRVWFSYNLRALYGRPPGHVRVIPVDFEVDDLAEVLHGAGFDSGRPALFGWEAVTQYLTEESVRATLHSSRRPLPAAG